MSTNNSNTCLLNKTCVPCKGGVPPLTSEEALKLLEELGQHWSINEQGHLYKEYKFNDFMSAVNLVNKIAKLSEEEGHHPNLTVSWGLCFVEIWTHKIDGLTESDFILAAKIDAAQV
jgi:4a-hydroxytetrahydrobiopterin dehydratase